MNLSSLNAEVAHLVEHDLAKVGVAGSSPVFRSKENPNLVFGFFVWVSLLLISVAPGGGTGRHVPMNIGMTRNGGESEGHLESEQTKFN